MAPTNLRRVGLARSGDKRAITLTLTVTLDGKILPFQIIYGGKTNQSLPRVTFPKGFSTSAKEKHHSNTEEVAKHLKEIIVPYINEERKATESESTCIVNTGCFSWLEKRNGNFIRGEQSIA